MKTLITVLIATFLLTTLAVQGQDAPKPERPGAAAGGRPFGMYGLPPQIGEKLNLTDEQKKTLMEIGQKYRPQFEELRKQMMGEFRSILTDEQKKTLDESIEQMRQRFQQGRGEGVRPAPESTERKPVKEDDKK